MAAKLLDEEIAQHLEQLSEPQKQVVLIVLRTLSAQNSSPTKITPGITEPASSKMPA